ncbi:MAG: hypothetical protein Q8M24_14535 [Pseudolabrys sp.]|nr:hypothetical protein [Pseudolabrys sp.]MDP2296665.1 hypothetical protein [Pseudolabrys sp.]
MSALLVEPMFWYGLALKIAITVSITVTASVAVERSGPFIGALIASLPTAGGAALIILAMEHPPSFIAQSMIGSLVITPVGAVFALTYAALAQRHGLIASLGGAFAVWFGSAFGLRLIDWSAETALLLNLVVFPLTIYAAVRFLGEGKVKARVDLTARDVIWRVGVVTFCVLIVTGLSSSIGTYFSGVFAFFPVAMSSFFIILHTRLGGPAAASVAAHVQAPFVGLVFGLYAVHLLAEPIGVWRSYGVGLAICMSWNGALWLWRRQRARRRLQA